MPKLPTAITLLNVVQIRTVAGWQTCVALSVFMDRFTWRLGLEIDLTTGACLSLSKAVGWLDDPLAELVFLNKASFYGALDELRVIDLRTAFDGLETEVARG